MGEGSFECSGSFDGKIDISGDVIIGQSGTAEAELKARSINIDGRLHGDATGTEKVQVGASGHDEGNLRAPAVQFIEGAFFEGNVEMRRPEHVGSEGNSTSNGDAAGEPSGEESTNDVVSDDSR
jgi:cytoskeletal protein CcmA (bactofilin family)